MAIDRSKFKSTPVQSMVQKDKDVETKMKKGGSYTEYLDIDEGLNTFRAYPAHPDSSSDQFAEAVTVAYLPVLYQEKDKDGNLLTEKGKPKMKEGRKSVFNSRIHGSAEKDLVEEYINFMEVKAKEFFETESEQKEFMENIKGRYDANPANRLQSSDYSTTWTLYADKYVAGVPSFGRLQIKKTVKERLNKIASQMDSSDSPLQTDPFSDTEEGRCFTIFYNKQAKKAADYYTTEIDSSTVEEKIGTRVVKVLKTCPLTDDQLEAFLKVPSLASQYHNVFKKKDFDFQMEGLKMLDDKLVDKFGLGAFQYDEWLDTCELLAEDYGEDEVADKPADEEVDNTEESDEVTTYDEIGDEFSEMDRTSIKQFLQINRTGIIIKSSDTDEVLRDKARAWKDAQLDGKDEDEETTTTIKVTETTGMTAKERIQALKDKAKLNK